jgi:heat shock protein HslJ
MNCFWRLIYVTVTVLLFVACSRKTAPLVSSMHTEGLHHKWKIIQAEGIQDAGSIYIDLRDVHHSGATAGCGYFSFTPKFGHYNRMQVANITSHLLSCTNDERDELLKVKLESVCSFFLAGNQLKLLAKDGNTLFSAERAADDEGNAINRKWWIQQMINADNEQLVKDKSFIDLTDVAKARGWAGCNNFSFNVVADNTYQITLSQVVSTEMFCKEAAPNESVFSKVLPLVNKYQVIGNTLKLFDKDNTILLSATEAL